MHLPAIAPARNVRPIVQYRRKIMLKFVKAAAVCAVLGIGALAGAPAQADTIHIGATHSGFGIVVSDRDGYRRDHYRPVRSCTTDRALDKARRMGVRRARVAYQNRAVISVRGHDRRGRITLTFGRSASCPMIR